jgi:hypothetical protein
MAGGGNPLGSILPRAFSSSQNAGLERPQPTSGNEGLPGSRGATLVKNQPLRGCKAPPRTREAGRSRRLYGGFVPGCCSTKAPAFLRAFPEGLDLSHAHTAGACSRDSRLSRNWSRIQAFTRFESAAVPSAERRKSKRRSVPVPNAREGRSRRPLLGRAPQREPDQLHPGQGADSASKTTSASHTRRSGAFPLHEDHSHRNLLGLTGAGRERGPAPRMVAGAGARRGPIGGYRPDGGLR